MGDFSIPKQNIVCLQTEACVELKKKKKMIKWFTNVSLGTQYFLVRLNLLYMSRKCIKKIQTFTYNNFSNEILFLSRR